MATRSVELQLKVQGATTLAEMEKNLNDINEELQKVDVNSQAFQDLSAAAQQANAVLEKTNEQIEGVTSLEKAEGAVKLGEGLVGGFAAAQSAAALFGAESAEAFEEASQKAILLFTALDGLKKVTEAFSKDTLKGLKGIRSGLVKTAGSVRLFGLSSAASLAIATAGITAIIALIVTLIENWDEATEAVRDFAEGVPILGDVVEVIDELIEKVGSLGNLFSALGAGIKGFFTIGTSAAAEFNKALEEGKAAERLQEAFEELSGINEDLSKSIQDNIEIINRSLQGYDDQIKKLKQQKQLTDDINEQRALDLAIQKEITKREEDRAKQLTDLLDGEISVRKTINLLLDENFNLQKEQFKIIQDQTKSEEEREEASKRFDELTKQRVTLNKTLKTLDDQINDAQFERLKLAFEAGKIEKEQFELAKARLLLEKEREQDYETFLFQLERQFETLEENQKLLEEIEKTEGLLSDKAQALLTVLEKQQEELKEQEKTLKDVVKSWDDAAKAASALDGEIDAITDDLELPEEEVETYAASWKTVFNVAQQQLQAQKEINGETMTATELVDQLKANYTDFLNTAAQLGGSAFDATLQFIQNAIDRTEQELDALIEQTEDSGERLAELEEELADAQGARREEILKAIAKEKKAEQDLATERLALQEKLANQKRAQAKAEKARAIFDATIAAALAVVQALPNIPLSIAVGVLGAAGVAAIASQPLPEFAEGGFTKDGGVNEVAGVVHAGEYVIPQSVLATRDGARMADTLEAMRLGMKGYQDGGIVTPDSVGNVEGETQRVVTALENAKIFVSVTEIRDVESNLEVIESRASL